MARNIKKLDWHLYIPKWDGNDKDENPISVEVHPLNHFELQKYGKASEEAKKDPEYTLNLAKKMFVDNVRNIKNLKVNDVSIETSDALWNLGISQIMNEISECILDLSKLQEHEKKT